METDAEPASGPGGADARATPRWPGALLALFFFAVGSLCLDDYGVTWDEPFTYAVGAQNLEIIGSLLRGEPVSRSASSRVLGETSPRASAPGSHRRAASRKNATA